MTHTSLAPEWHTQMLQYPKIRRQRLKGPSPKPPLACVLSPWWSVPSTLLFQSPFFLLGQGVQITRECILPHLQGARKLPLECWSLEDLCK